MQASLAEAPVHHPVDGFPGVPVTAALKLARQGDGDGGVGGDGDAQVVGRIVVFEASKADEGRSRSRAVRLGAEVDADAENRVGQPLSEHDLGVRWHGLDHGDVHLGLEVRVVDKGGDHAEEVEGVVINLDVFQSARHKARTRYGGCHGSAQVDYDYL